MPYGSMMSSANSATAMGVGGTASLLGLGLGIYGLVNGADSEQRSPGKETGETLAVKRLFGDQAFAQGQLDASRNTYLNELMLSNYLLGSRGGPQTVSWDLIQNLGGGRYKPIHHEYAVNTPASRGLLNVMREDILPAQDRMTLESLARQSGGSIDILQALGPAALQAYRSSIDPKRTKLLSDLTDQASEELAAGPGLDPALRREFKQAVRSAQASRGMGFGNMDAWQEMYSIGQAGEARRRQRQDQALRVLGMHQALEPDLTNVILGRPAQTGAANQFALSAFGQAAAPAQYDPFAGGFEAAYDFNANARQAAKIADYNALMGMSSGLIGGGLGLMGSAAASG